MKLFELEIQLGFTFPKAFHTIYETGAMKWLELSEEQIKTDREKYINDIYQFAGQMMDDYGLNKFKIHPWGEK